MTPFLHPPLRFRGRYLPLCWGLLAPLHCVGAQEIPASPPDYPPPTVPPRSTAPVEVNVERASQHAATQTRVAREVLEVFPSPTAEGLLRVVPGLHLSTHGGRGKASQFFVRGFDAVHGSDLAVSLEGIPLNEVSNIHGQGYLDLHFLPSSLLSGLQFVKAAPAGSVGDFALAAAIDYSLGLEKPGTTATAHLGAGQGILAEGAGLEVTYRPVQSESGTFVLAEVEGGQGVGERRAFQAARAAAGLQGEWGAWNARAFVLAYQGRFDSPGVLREDDILAGTQDFYGAYPEAGGGVSSRLLGGVKSSLSLGPMRLEALGWAGGRGLELRHNFTGYLYDAENGDGRRQTQETTQGGTSFRLIRWEPVLGGWSVLEVGLSSRWDGIHQTEQHISPEGLVVTENIDASLFQQDLGMWLDARLELPAGLRMMSALRLDRLDFWLDRHIDSQQSQGQGEVTYGAGPARAYAWALTPRASLSLPLFSKNRAFLSYHRGFRSPEARGLEDGVAPVTRADTLELGAVLGPTRGGETLLRGPGGGLFPGSQLSAVMFLTGISDELVFDHTAGRYLASGQTRRLGGELTGILYPLEWLRIVLEATYTDGRYVATGASLPFAPRLLTSMGIYTQDLPLPLLTVGATVPQLSSGLRAWGMGPRPLGDGFLSQPTFGVDLTSHLRWSRVALTLDIQNLLARELRDGEFVYASWFDRTRPRSELPVVHITAGAPFQVHLGVEWRL